MGGRCHRCEVLERLSAVLNLLKNATSHPRKCLWNMLTVRLLRPNITAFYSQNRLKNNVTIYVAEKRRINITLSL